MIIYYESLIRTVRFAFAFKKMYTIIWQLLALFYQVDRLDRLCFIQTWFVVLNIQLWFIQLAANFSIYYANFMRSCVHKICYSYLPFIAEELAWSLNYRTWCFFATSPPLLEMFLTIIWSQGEKKNDTWRCPLTGTWKKEIYPLANLGPRTPGRKYFFFCCLIKKKKSKRRRDTFRCWSYQSIRKEEEEE